MIDPKALELGRLLGQTDEYKAFLRASERLREEAACRQQLAEVERLAQEIERAAQEGREPKLGEYRTACQESCPTKAIRFGDLDGELEGVRENERAFTLLEDLGLMPKVIYLKEKTS